MPGPPCPGARLSMAKRRTHRGGMPDSPRWDARLTVARIPAAQGRPKVAWVTTFLLIPGAGGQAWYWHRVVPELVARGHDGVAVELPSGDDTAGFVEYADAAVAAVKDGTEDLVVVW